MNPRIRLTSAKVEVRVEVEAELGNIILDKNIDSIKYSLVIFSKISIQYNIH